MKTYNSSFLLFLTACIWGVAFVAQSVATAFIGPFTFNAIRFVIGGIVLLPVLKIMGKTLPREKRKITWQAGFFCGLCLCGGSLCQQYGIQFTTVGKAGFITALYIIIVPLCGILQRKKIPVTVWAGAAVAITGFYLLCVKEGMSINKGDLLLLAGALIFSIHILVIDYYSPKADGVQISCIQFFISGAICTVGMVFFEKPDFAAVTAAYLPLLYAGVMSCGVAYTLQIIGQKHTPPAVASLVLSLESVVAVLAGWVILGQEMNAREITGSILVFAAILLAQLPERKKEEIAA